MLDHYGKAFRLWRAAAGDHWSDFVEHEFTRGLGDGTLRHEAFLAFLQQDYLYLMEYGKGWALAVTKAATPREMSTCIKSAHAFLADEADLHLRLCEAAGLSRESVIAGQEAIETIAYTRFVLSSGLTGDFLDLMAALAPCEFGYGQIGVALKSGQTSDRYGEWIESYGGPEFQEGCVTIGKLIDDALVARLGPDFETSPRWNELVKKFVTATRLEAAFFSLGLRNGAPA
ncbi:MAG: TenA family protein [Rhodobacterales bacterium]|nr:TenA family protein [Rhodobacterales bacterium]